MRKKWVTFDLDGTLIQNPLSKWVIPELEEFIQEYTGKEMRVTEYVWKEHHTYMEQDQVIVACDWDWIMSKFLSEHNIKLDVNIEAIVKKHSTYPKVYLLEESIIDDLHQLKSKGYYLAAVTNGLYKYQYPVVKALGLTELFDDMITPSEVGYAKPNIQMVDRLYEDGEIIAHVGDRVDHDVYFSNQLNALSVLLDATMPDEIKSIALNERVKNQEYLDMINEKNPLIDEKHYPKMIIHSITEINEIL